MADKSNIARRDPKGVEGPAKGTDEDALIREARNNYHDAYTNDILERQKCQADLEFAFDPEQQWDATVKANRLERPCFSYNRVEPAIDQIVGDQRKTRLGIKTIPTEGGDKETAKVMSGMIRNIENISGAKNHYDEQFENSVGGGFGCFRVVNEYNNDDSFDQDCFIKGLRNPNATAWFDPGAEEWHKQDGDFCFVTKWISEDSYDRQWPDFSPNSWDNYTDAEYWRNGRLVNVAEYYRKKWGTKTLVQLSDGRIVWQSEIDKLSDETWAAMGVEIAKTRDVEAYTIEWFMLSGWNILDGPIEYNWRFFPVVPVWGKRRIIRNREQYKGLTRNARDPQTSYNYSKTSIVEAAVNTPKTPYLVTTRMVEGLKTIWDNITKENRPYVPFNFDKRMPEGPKRQDFQQIPQTLVALTQMDAEDIKATTGMQDPSMGMAQGAQQSGEAVGLVQGQSETGNFRYIDSLAQSIQMLGTILVDIIPTIYDTERTIRIIGEDDIEEYVEINKPGPDGEIMHDMEMGKYDVVVDVGPTHATQRREAGEFLKAVVPNSPILQELAMDIVFKYQDVPGADEIHERVRQHYIQAGKVPPETDEEQQWAPQGPSEAEELNMRTQIALVLNTEADTMTKQAEVQKIIAETYKKTMEGEEIAVEIDSDAAVGEMLGQNSLRPQAPNTIPGLPGGMSGPPTRLQ